MKTRNIFATLALIAFCAIGAFAQPAKSTGPQLIRDVDQPARQPFYKFTTVNGAIIETVPAGKVLVIEFVNGRVSTITSGSGELALITHAPGTIEMYNIFGPSHYSEHSSTNKSYYTHSAKIYVQAGRSLSLNWTGDGQYHSMVASISGYYVDVP